MAVGRPPPRIQVLVIMVATFAWVTQLIVSVMIPRIPLAAGATDAFFGVLAAAMTFPEINKLIKRRKGDEDEE